jgi:hypothetical protein
MEKNIRINPVGLKGNEINERMRQLMGMAPINEGVSRSTVELTKIGPDGKAYGIVRENHEYYIKVSDKTSNITVEDFKYIGGLQNKKSEAYSSYAKATKHLNFKFNSICESFDIVNTFNVFVDDNLLSEGAAKEATKHITDAKGKELGGKVKEEGGDNLAEKKVMDEMEEVTLTEDELAIDAMLNEVEEIDEEESKDNPWAICTASVGREDKEKYEACVMDVKKQKGIKEELKGDQHKIDANKNGKIDGDDFKILKKEKTNENFEQEDMSTDELMDRLDNMSAAEFIELLGDAGKDIMRFAKRKIEGGAKFMLNKMGHPVDEEMTIEEIQEAIADLKKKL